MMKHLRITFVLSIFLVIACTPLAAQISTEIPSAAVRPIFRLPLTHSVHSQGIESTQISGKDGVNLVYVPAGEFQMGSDKGYDNEKPVHTVYLDAYWIDQTEVTNGMYAKCVSGGGCKAPGAFKSFTRDHYYDSQQYADYPVFYVDWNQANIYCLWVGRNLPSEAQWEKAAHGTNARTYPWGEGIDSSKANYNQNVKDTTKVGFYIEGASPYGALDLSGNVWEWVADGYDHNYYEKSPYKNPTGPVNSRYRLLRGGSLTDSDLFTRTTHRFDVDLSILDYYPFGFRCAVKAAP